jgi:hypothetical protein
MVTRMDGVGAAGRTGAAPWVVIDGAGVEVGVLVSYDQYVRLLKLVAEGLDRGTLPPYWRRALDGCLALEGAPVSRTPAPGTTRPSPRPGRARRSALGGS